MNRKHEPEYLCSLVPQCVHSLSLQPAIRCKIVVTSLFHLVEFSQLQMY